MRNKILSCALAACASTSLYAGTMGPVVMAEPTFKPFIIGEAAYSWPMVSGLDMKIANLATITSKDEVQGWGGRLAAGMIRPIGELFALSFEGGLIYNDHVAITPVFTIQGAQVIPPANTVIANFDQYGIDLLAGINYTRPKYDLFFKAGALVENLRGKILFNTNLALINNIRRSDFVPNAHQGFTFNVGQAMPEIKLGGNYHVTDNWSLTASWMHAFGGSLGFTTGPSTLASGSVSISDVVLNLQNPTLNTVLFGLQYQFS